MTLGGVMEDRAMVVEPALQLESGREYVLFLDVERAEDESPALRRSEPEVRQSVAYADTQGAILLDGGLFRDPLVLPAMTERDLLDRISALTGRLARDPGGAVFLPRPGSAPEPREPLAPSAITSLSPNPTNAGTIAPADFLTITGSGFGAAPGTVGFANTDDGGATSTFPTAASDYVSWSDTSITVKVPWRAGTGTVTINGSMPSSTPLTIGYSHWSTDSSGSGWPSPTRIRWYLRNLNSSGGYTFQYNSTSGFSANAAAVAAFERALATWRCSIGVNLTRTKTTTTLGQAVDGNMVVLFDSSLPAGNFGKIFYSWKFSSTASCNLANAVWWQEDIDIKFKPDPLATGISWQYGPALATSSQWDFESVALHELGHGIGLGHRIAPGELMNRAGATGQNNRSPAAIEVTGGAAKVAYSVPATSFNPTNPGTPMVAVPAASSTL